MNRKILVTYATRCGSTAEIANTIAQTISSASHTVITMPIQEVASLAGYDAVVIGSPVRFGGWLPEAQKFITQHREQLNQMPAAYFTVHVLSQGDDCTSTSAREAYLAGLRTQVTPRITAFFTGKIDPARLSFTERVLASIIKSAPAEQDVDAIQRWAREVSAKFFPPPADSQSAAGFQPATIKSAGILFL